MNKLGLRKTTGSEAWELVHPRCAQERAEDIQEVQQMLAAGEFEIARDELRWLLEECTDFIEGHKLLGELALLEDDVPLARGHFGTGYQLGHAAIAASAVPPRLPYLSPANQAFFECGKGLAWCLLQLGKRELAVDVVQQFVALDPTDPLQLQELLTIPGDAP